MNNLYTFQSSNIRRTWLLFAVFIVAIIGVGYIFALAYNDISFVFLAGVFSIVYSMISYWFAPNIALSLARARYLEKKDNPYLYNLVENLAITAGLPTPKIYITPEMQINAFATGRKPENSVVAVTHGALEKLEKTELEGVLAHELSHIGNRDILISTMAAILAGVVTLLADIFLRSSRIFDRRDRSSGQAGQIIFLAGIILSVLAPIGAMLIQLAISRRRESLADASAVLLTRYPEGFISALQKIGADQTPMPSARSSTAHMWIDTPFKGGRVSWFQKIFMTHPPIQERIAALRNVSI